MFNQTEPQISEASNHLKHRALWEPLDDTKLTLASCCQPVSTATSLHAGQEDRGSLSQLALGEHCLRLLWKDWKTQLHRPCL
jgi:hypothetical protein